ncbi:MAG: hypothetical protein HY782_18170 [Chloroflexi bacterium]|nr:hypothetical protein [Chloroflexota bacterium]
MSKNLILERTSLPPTVLEWLEADEKKNGIFLYHEENGQIVLERLENIDPAMLMRVREDIQRYHSVLERLADS